MEIIAERMKTAEDRNPRVSISAYEQQKKGSEEVAEQKKMNTQHNTKKQQASYDAVSRHGDTLFISEAGKATSFKKSSRQAKEDTTDGAVLQKKKEENEQEQEREVSTINLSSYTESELKRMYLNGDITRAEYDKEVNSREKQG